MGFVAAAIGIIGLLGANKAAKDAKRAAKGEAALDLRATQEKIFLNKQEERILAGTTRAAAAGSNVKADIGSPLTILAEQARTFARERKFISEVGAERSKLAIQRGKNVASQVRFAAAGSALQAFGSSASATVKNKGFFGFG